MSDLNRWQLARAGAACALDAISMAQPCSRPAAAAGARTWAKRMLQAKMVFATTPALSTMALSRIPLFFSRLGSSLGILLLGSCSHALCGCPGCVQPCRAVQLLPGAQLSRQRAHIVWEGHVACQRQGPQRVQDVLALRVNGCQQLIWLLISAGMSLKL